MRSEKTAQLFQLRPAQTASTPEQSTQSMQGNLALQRGVYEINEPDPLLASDEASIERRGLTLVPVQENRPRREWVRIRDFHPADIAVVLVVISLIVWAI